MVTDIEIRTRFAEYPLCLREKKRPTSNCYHQKCAISWYAVH